MFRGKFLTPVRLALCLTFVAATGTYILTRSQQTFKFNLPFSLLEQYNLDLVSEVEQGSADPEAQTLTDVYHTAFGPLRGRVRRVTHIPVKNDTATSGDVDTATVEEFLGVRFAAAPTGALRFEKPVDPPLNSDSVMNALERAPFCPQDSTPTYIGNAIDEDCLFFNMWVP